MGLEMARKMITREITSTTVKVAEMILEDGQPVAVALPDVILVGNVTLEKAQKEVNKLHGRPVTVLTLSANTQSYELPVETFLQHATVKETPAE
jgi:hypothetical protein